MKLTMERFLICAVALIVIAGAWLKPMEPVAMEYVDAGLRRALVSFAVARTINAGLSAAQGTGVSVSPFGIGLHFTPGQVLRPMNDVVAQFAELMLAASVAFGVMKVLLSIGSVWLVSLLLSGVALWWVISRWRGSAAPIWIAMGLVTLLLVRFAVPVVIIGGEIVFENFLASEYATNQKAIEQDSTQLDSFTPPVTKAGISEWIEKMKEAARQLTERVIKLIVVFLLQTLVIPLLLFWALYRVASILVESPPRGVLNQALK